MITIYNNDNDKNALHTRLRAASRTKPTYIHTYICMYKRPPSHRSTVTADNNKAFSFPSPLLLPPPPLRLSLSILLLLFFFYFIFFFLSYRARVAFLSTYVQYSIAASIHTFLYRSTLLLGSRVSPTSKSASFVRTYV